MARPMQPKSSLLNPEVSVSRYQHVLVPVDFSDCSDSVVRHAADLAGPHGAALVLLHAIALPVGLEVGAKTVDARGLSVPVMTQLRDEASIRMAPLLELVREQGVAVRARIVNGPPAARALEEAERLPADLIVLGSHGRTGVRRLILGSVSEEVVRHANVPVVTVRSRHHAACEAASCETCRSGSLDALLQAEAELDGWSRPVEPT